VHKNDRKRHLSTEISLLKHTKEKHKVGIYQWQASTYIDDTQNTTSVMQTVQKIHLQILANRC